MLMNCHNQLSKQQTLLLVTSVAAISLFAYHSYTIISRYMKYEILATSTILQNESLPYPVVHLQMDSHRNPNIGVPFPDIGFAPLLNNEPLPDWAFAIFAGRIDEGIFQAYISLNVVDPKNYEVVKNHSVSWPLREHYATGYRNSGLMVVAFIDTTNFIETLDGIFLQISNVALDPNGFSVIRGVPENFQLFPCEAITIEIALLCSLNFETTRPIILENFVWI